MSRPALASFAAAFLGASACAGGGPAAAGGGGDLPGCVPSPVEARRDVPYAVRGDAASDALTTLDVHPPPGAPCGRQIVVWVHGGAWSGGDKANQLDAKIPFFNGLGAVLVSVNYRLTTAAGTVQHPDHVEDVAAAVAWIRAHAVELGGDPARIALLGHSAGAHLAALAVTNPRFLAAHGLTAADVACVGSYDTEYTASEIVARDPAYEAVFSSDPATWADASPSGFVRDGLPPFQLACRGTGGRDAQCRAFADALRGAGGAAQIIDAAPLSHEQVNSEIGLPTDSIMTPAIEAFLRDCGA